MGRPTSSKPKVDVCKACGWPAINVAALPKLDANGLCFYCRRGLWVGVKRSEAKK